MGNSVAAPSMSKF